MLQKKKKGVQQLPASGDVAFIREKKDYSNLLMMIIFIIVAGVLGLMVWLFGFKVDQGEVWKEIEPVIIKRIITPEPQ